MAFIIDIFFWYVSSECINIVWMYNNSIGRVKKKKHQQLRLAVILCNFSPSSSSSPSSPSLRHIKHSWQQRRRYESIMCCQSCRGVCRQPHFVKFSLLKPFRLCSPVLEPDFHLRLGQLEVVGELCSLSDAQILLFFELVFQRHQLARCEWGARFPVSLVLS